MHARACLGWWVLASVLTGSAAPAAERENEAARTRRMQPAQPTKRLPSKPPTSPTGRRAVLEGWTGPVVNLRLFDLEGRDVTQEVRPRDVQGRVTFDTLPQRQLVAKTRTITSLALQTAEQMLLPGGIVVPRAERAGLTSEARLSWLRLTLAASPMPVPWNATSGAYSTRLTFGLKPPDNGGEAITLERPVIVKLEFDGLTGPAVPPITIEAVGLEHEKTVELRFEPVRRDPKLLVRSTLSDVDLKIAALPRLDVRPVQRAVLGFGLASVNVTVSNVHPHGEVASVTTPTAIVLDVDGRATPEPAALTLNPGESRASFQLRSAGVGAVTVRATAGRSVGAAVIEQRFPWGPLVAALLGGSLGGYARRFVKGARRAAASRRVIEGVVVGLVAFVAAVLGVGYLQLPAPIVATEAGAFLTAVLCGFVGVAVLDALTKKRQRTT
ncbi:MAG: hypothetical protein GEU99_25155 [Luteitalea sp.]|nr:hypothetical protein [Luteitalea sp.]